MVVSPILAKAALEQITEVEIPYTYHTLPPDHHQQTRQGKVILVV